MSDILTLSMIDVLNLQKMDVRIKQMKISI